MDCDTWLQVWKTMLRHFPGSVNYCVGVLHKFPHNELSNVQDDVQTYVFTFIGVFNK